MASGEKGNQQLVFENVTPATRLLDKRRQHYEVEDALAAQKAKYAREEESFKKKGEKAPWLKPGGGKKSSLRKRDGSDTRKPKVKFDSSTSSKDIPCRYFPTGQCTRGESCPFKH